MARPIDEKIVRMTLDNVKFLSNVKDTLKSLTSLNDGVKGNKTMDIGGLGESVSNIDKKFSLLGVSAGTVISKLTSSAMDMGKKLYDTVVGPIVEGGKKRALNIEQAKFQFQGLGMDVDATMASALEAVKGTAFGLDEAAVVASQFGATGMRAGEEMTASLRGISGVAAMTGSSYADIGSIFTTVAGNGRLMGSELLRLSGRGINAAATLSQALGITEAEVREMVTDGKISFQMFSDAMSNAFGEHATRANETYVGSLSNVKAALSRIGAAIFAPEFENKRDIFNVLTPKIDDLFAAITPLIDVWTKFRRMGAEVLMKAISKIDFSPFERLGTIRHIADGFLNLMDSGKFILQAFAAAWSKLFPSNGWDLIPRILTVITYAFKQLTSVVRLAASIISLFINIIGVAFSAVSTVLNIVVRLAGALLNIFPKFKGGGKNFIDMLANGVMWLSKLAEGFRFSIKEGGLIDKTLIKISDTMGKLGALIGKLIKPIFGFFKGLATRVIGFGKAIGSTFKEAYNIIFKGNYTGKGPWEEDSKIVDWMFKIREAALKVGHTFKELYNVLFKGNFEGKGFWNENSKIITSLSKIRGAVLSFKGAIVEVYNILFKGNYTGKGPWEEDSKIVDWFFKIRQAALDAVSGVKEAYSILFKGEFTGKGPWDESSKIVDVLFNIREAVLNTVSAIKEAYSILFKGEFTGKGPWDESSVIVDALFRIREAVLITTSAISEAYSILFKGKFTGKGPWDESSKIVDVLFRIREAAIDAANGISEAYNILFKGVFTGKGPWEEDSKIVNWLFRIRESAIEASKGIKEAVSVILKDLGEAVVTIGKGVVSGVWNKDSVIFKWMGWVKDAASDVISYVRGLNLEPIGQAITNAFNYVKSIDLTPIGEGLVNAYEGLVKGFNWILDAIVKTYNTVKEFIVNLDWKKVFAVGVGGGLVGVAVMVVKSVLGVFNSFKDFGGLGSSIGDFIDGATSALGQVEGALKSLTLEVRSKALINIAIAVGILAGALYVLSGLDGEDIAVGLGAIVVSMAALVGAMTLITKFDITGAGFRASFQIIGLSIAMILIAKAIEEIAYLDLKEIGRGLTVIITVLGALSGALVLISRFGGGAIGATSLQIVAIAGALKLIVGVVEEFGFMKTDTLKQGVAAVGVVLLELGIFMLMVTRANFGIGSALGLLGIIGALMLVDKAVVNLGSIDVPVLKQGLAAIGGILAAVGLFSLVAGRVNLLQVGAGILVLSVALTALTIPILTLGNVKLETLAIGLGAIAVAIVAIGLTSKLLTGIGMNALGLIAFSIGLSMLMQPIIILGKMNLKTLAKGIGAIAVALVAIGLASKLLTGSALAAIGLIGIAFALTLLVPPIAMLGKLSWEAIGKGLVAMAGGILLLGGAAMLLGLAAVPLMLGAAGLMAIGIAAALLGGGLAAAGAGLALFSTSLVTLAAMSGTAVVTIVSILGTLVSGIAILIPDIVKMISLLIKKLIDTLIEHGPVLYRKFTEFMIVMLEAAEEQIPKLGRAFTGFLIAIMDTIEENTPPLVFKFQEMVINLLNAMADSLEQNGDAFINAFLRLMGEVILLVIKAGAEVVTALFSWIPGIEETMSEVTATAEGVIRDKFGAAEVASEKMGEFVGGIEQSIPEVERATEMVSEYGMNSLGKPDYTPIGEENIGEYGTGMGNMTDTVVRIAEGVTTDGKVAMEGVDHTPSGELNAGEYGTGIDNMKDMIGIIGEGVSKYGLSSIESVDHTPAGESNAKEYGDGIDSQKPYVESSADNTASAGVSAMNSVDASPAGESLTSGFAGGIVSESVVSLVTGNARRVASIGYNAINSFLDINSPSKLLRKSGNSFGSGFAYGIADKIKNVATSAKDMAVQASHSLSNALDVILPKDNEIRLDVVVDGSSLDNLNDYRVANLQPDLSMANGVLSNARIKVDGLDAVMNQIRGMVQVNGQNESNNNALLREQTDLLVRIAGKDPNIIINKRHMKNSVNDDNAFDKIGNNIF